MNFLCVLGQDFEISEDFEQHFGCDDEHKDCEVFLELWHGKGVCGFGTQGGEANACDDDRGEGRQVEVAEAIGW